MSRNWLPRQGVPESMMEKATHKTIQFFAWLPVYTALIATLTLLVVIFGIPFVGK